MNGYASRLSGNIARLRALSPQEKIRREKAAFSALQTRLVLAAGNGVYRKSERFKKVVSTMEAMSPLAVLSRGYTITMDEHNEVVRSAGELLPGALIRTVLPDGEFVSVIQQTKRKAETT